MSFFVALFTVQAQTERGEDMFGKLFGKRELLAPVSGACIPLSEVDEPAFAQGMVGPGVAIVPTSTEVHAPCDGQLVVLPETAHAFAIDDGRGAQVLVHIGIDTVELVGKGFEALAAKGDRVKAGQPIVSFDAQAMAEAGVDMTVMVILLEADASQVKPLAIGKSVTAGQDAVCAIR